MNFENGHYWHCTKTQLRMFFTFVEQALQSVGERLIAAVVLIRRNFWKLWKLFPLNSSIDNTGTSRGGTFGLVC